MKKNDIHMRDPFVLPEKTEGVYYLFGTTDEDPWKSPGVGFNCFTSSDLEIWAGPIEAFRPEPGFWAETNFWAPEVHQYRGAYYMFASFKAAGKCRATQILRADRPAGPYRVHSPEPVTPAEWECLDGTLYVDSEGMPWLVFCHEWVQVRDGEVRAVRLSEDLTRPVGKPELLFTATLALWTRPHRKKDGSIDERDRVTDGPFLYRMTDGTLLMLWSSFSDTGYAMGIARSESGEIHGPWHQLEKPLSENDSGHGMVFRTFDGRLFMTVHQPNGTPDERPVFFELVETAGGLRKK